ncbi:hypothetical protein ONV78_24055 [Hahella sp. CR1]|uniref:hypothetical protein n=1 Tax=Hahella sp. CR1 TaxID=2992807 RepID=UPI0024412274|nr:hypothetical protein [Hahella sp. CR1]MDG9670834.1 hypothetical protein [Hahella sp. CR1]
MGHNISGIVTSFKYQGDLPHLYLVGNYAFIPLCARTKGFRGSAIAPFARFGSNLTPKIKKLTKELSFTGMCGFIETSYHGGYGSQLAVVWEYGSIIYGPVESGEAINEALKLMGIWRHEGKDEFDTARLGWYRDNKEVLLEINQQLNE